ncbi:PepSY domain-containing protein [Pseudomonas sp. ABC1]|uniref:PepSY-associated TM helix domain-containing protein n=1 Tax=Pseudomonas sp. ABC1 TaxID=2748080 RepID=UPI0015C36A23|nr:PepSY-associated TM helix domain-containing protein [Pseudomonas sp. ABC1]QLF93696.1 PepSY domain-containing protein [Pseudomonas sp. ABC1]
MRIQEKKTHSRWYRANLWIHRWISLFVALPFAILCVTGVVLIFHEEIEHLAGSAPQAVQSGGQAPRPLMESIAVAERAHPGERVQSATLDAEHFPGLVLLGLLKDGDSFQQARWVYADIAQAKLVEQPAFDETLMGFLLELHAQWFLGTIGELIGALIALLVLLSLVSGVVVYAPYIKKFLFGIIRTSKGKRLFQLDLHNLIGSVVLGWAFIVTLTGVLLGFGTVAIGVWQLTELDALRQQYPQESPAPLLAAPDLDRVYAAAAEAAEGWNPTTVLFPGSEYSTPRHYLVLLQGGHGFDEKMLQLALVDAHSFDVARLMQLPVYLKAILLSQPLHFGDYGGLPLKILWALCTLLTLFITLNGAWLWWAKRRKIN